MSEYLELKSAFEKAEKDFTAAYRRARWLEHRLYNAGTEAEYSDLAAQLDRQEEQLKSLGINLSRARFALAGADMNATA